MNEVPNTNVEQPTVEAQPEAKVLQQHEINALVAGSKQKGYEKGKNEGYQQAKAELMANINPVQPPVYANASATTDHDSRLRQIAMEELSKQRAVDQANWEAKQRTEAGTKILNELKAKSAAALPKFEDYEKVVHKEFENFEKVPEVLALANNFDNAGEMLYDIGKNPVKMLNIVSMVRAGMVNEAYSEMKKLSDSIKVNEMSANQPKAKTPLSQVNPSIVGVGKTDGNISSNDFRGRY